MKNIGAAARAIPRDAWLMLSSLFLSSLPVGLLMVFFPLYLRDLGLRPLFIGGVLTAAGVGASVLLFAIGPLADRFGRRPFLLAGTVFPALAFVIYLATTDVPWLVAASMIGGVGFSGGLGSALTQATFDPMLAGTVESRLRTTVLSGAEIAWSLALAVGAMLSAIPSWLVRAHVAAPLAADRTVFLLGLLAIVAGTALLLPVRERGHGPPAQPLQTTPTPHLPAPQKPLPRPAPQTTMRESLPLVLKLAVFLALQGAGLGLVVQLLPLWFTLRFHAGAAAIAPWFALAQGAGIPLVLFVPWLARRLGVARVIVLVAATSTLMLAGVPLAPILPLAGICYVARSALVSMQWPAQISFLQGAVDPRLRGTASSVALSCWSLANALFPVLAGYLLGRGLLVWPIALGALCYAAAALWFFLALRRTPLPEEVGDEADSVLIPMEMPAAR